MGHTIYYINSFDFWYFFKDSVRLSILNGHSLHLFLFPNIKCLQGNKRLKKLPMVGFEPGPQVLTATALPTVPQSLRCCFHLWSGFNDLGESS